MHLVANVAMVTNYWLAPSQGRLKMLELPECICVCVCLCVRETHFCASAFVVSVETSPLRSEIQS